MRKRTRLMAVGAAIGIVAGGSGVAVAATSGSSSPAGAAAKKHCVVVKAKSGTAADVTAVFEKAGVTGVHATPVALKTALRDAQAASTSQAGIVSSGSVAVFARDLHLTTAQAQKFLGWTRIVKSSGAKKAQTLPQTAVHDLATRLGVSDDRAGQVIASLGSTKGRVSPADAGFVAMARGLGVTPRQLAAALLQMKRDFVGASGCRS